MNRRNKPPFLKALLWFILNFVYGFFPFWIIWILGFISKNDATISHITKVETTHLLRDCAVLFICCAIMGAATIDFMFSKINSSKWLTFGVTVTSFLPMIIVSGIYLYLIAQNHYLSESDTFISSQNIENLTIFQYIGMGYCVVYCIIVKRLLFKREDKLTIIKP